MIDQLPPSVTLALERALEALHAHPQHRLSLRHRLAIYERIDACAGPDAHAIKAWASIVTTQRILPVWKMPLFLTTPDADDYAYWSTLPNHPLNLAIAVLTRETSAAGALDQASHWQEVTTLTGQLNESPYYHEWCVFDTALTSLWAVLLPDFWHNVAPHPATTPDSADETRFASPDPAHWASLAWEGGRWTPDDPRQWRYDDQRQMWLTENTSWYFEAYGTWDRTTPDTIVRRHAFWDWWLTHPFQEAWAHVQPG